MTNHHCSVVKLAGVGVLVEGPSGSGKTSLCLGLIEHCKRTGIDAALVSDDQVLLSVENNTLIAQAPRSIAGKIEIRGFGISKIKHEPRTDVHLVARIIADEKITRMPSPANCELHGVTLKLCEIPTRHEQAGIRIIIAKLIEQFPTGEFKL